MTIEHDRGVVKEAGVLASASSLDSNELPFVVPRVLHIDRIDWGTLTLSTNDGHEFEELVDGTWVECAPVVQGSVRWWGGGCHSGQINFTPLYVYWDGQWVNAISGRVNPQVPLRKYSQSELNYA